MQPSSVPKIPKIVVEEDREDDFPEVIMEGESPSTQ